MMIVSILSAILLSLTGFAQPAEVSEDHAPPYTFAVWKDQQVEVATNGLFKATARMNQLKAGKLPLTKDTAGKDPLELAEKELRRAKESLETAHKLQMIDYVNIYLPSLEADPENVQKLVDKWSKEELSEVAKLLLLKGNTTDARRNPPVVSGLPRFAPSRN